MEVLPVLVFCWDFVVRSQVSEHDSAFSVGFRCEPRSYTELKLKKKIMALYMSCHHLSALDISFGCAPFKPAFLQAHISSSYV